MPTNSSSLSFQAVKFDRKSGSTIATSSLTLESPNTVVDHHNNNNNNTQQQKSSRSFVFTMNQRLVVAFIRCFIVSAFTSRLPQRSTVSFRRFLSNEIELVLQNLIQDEVARLVVRVLFEQEEKLLEKEKNLLEKEGKLLEKEGMLLEKEENRHREVVQLHRELIRQKEEEKENVFQVNVQLIASKNSEIARLEVDLLASNSRLTVRGVVEHFGHCLKQELLKANFVKRTGSMTETLINAANMSYVGDWSVIDYPNVVLLRTSYEKCVTNAALWNGDCCSKFFAGLYGELSKGIHGAPWAGPNVLNTLTDGDGGSYSCFLKELCKEKFSLELVLNSNVPTVVVPGSSDGATLPEKEVEKDG